MISQVSPEEFSSAYQNGKASELNLTLIQALKDIWDSPQNMANIIQAALDKAEEYESTPGRGLGVGQS
jgi:TfoX/Sxy family transcriptional regulator of competence genes